MKVVLPDNSELELPAGATGLDAARAIGPKLAEQAVLVRVDGQRPGPAAAARRRRADPAPDDARQGRPRRALRAPPFLRAPARRGRPPPLSGREDRDRAADRERLLLRLRVPGADPRGGPRADRGRDPARAEGGTRVGARGDLPRRGAAPASRRKASRTRSSSSTPPRATSRSTRSPRGEAFTDLCRGPHLQNSKPIKAVKLTGLAGAYWRGDSSQPQLTRIYGTAFYTQEDLDAYLERLEEARRRDHRRLGTAARPLPLRRALARLAVLASEGDGDLERARGPPPARERASAATSR